VKQTKEVGKMKARRILCVYCLLLFFLAGCANIGKIAGPPFPQWRRHYWEDKELWGNQGIFPKGYVVGKPQVVKEEILPEPEEAILPKEAQEIEEPEVIMEEEMPQPKEKELPRTYTVKKGESLWDIAGYPEIYGNPLLWPRIYEANRDKIKNPNLIYPGQVLVIPREKEVNKEKKEYYIK